MAKGCMQVSREGPLVRYTCKEVKKAGMEKVPRVEELALQGSFNFKLYEALARHDFQQLSQIETRSLGLNAQTPHCGPCQGKE